MDTEKYIFIGNRFYVLQKMFHLGCRIEEIYAVKDSYLEEELIRRKIQYTDLPKKEKLIEQLSGLDYDILVSNGCPYILPISTLQKGNQKYINIHPSLLPDLKGKHPINGALLYERKHGVTCHYMDDGIDTGAIISQIEIPITDELDLELLYQISFRAEGKVFENAYHKNYEAQKNRARTKDVLYYSRDNEDMILKKTDEIDVLIHKVRAFSMEGLYAGFERGGAVFKVIDTSIINNGMIKEMYQDCEDNLILIVTKGKILVKFHDQLLWLKMQNTAGLREQDVFLE